MRLSGAMTFMFLALHSVSYKLNHQCWGKPLRGDRKRHGLWVSTFFT